MDAGEARGDDGTFFGSDKIGVIAELRAKSGHESELRSALEGLVEPSRKEAGCLAYNVYESMYYPGDLFTYEEWESEKRSRRTSKARKTS